MAGVGQKILIPQPVTPPPLACVGCSGCPAPLIAPPAKCPTSTCDTPNPLITTCTEPTDCPCFAGVINNYNWVHTSWIITGASYQTSACMWRRKVGEGYRQDWDSTCTTMYGQAPVIYYLQTTKIPTGAIQWAVRVIGEYQNTPGSYTQPGFLDAADTPQHCYQIGVTTTNGPCANDGSLHAMNYTHRPCS